MTVAKVGSRVDISQLCWTSFRPKIARLAQCNVILAKLVHRNDSSTLDSSSNLVRGLISQDKNTVLCFKCLSLSSQLKYEEAVCAVKTSNTILQVMTMDLLFEQQVEANAWRQ